jgi:diadenosine tetraphosphate (Ap4A) HIT family hydrolase
LALLTNKIQEIFFMATLAASFFSYLAGYQKVDAAMPTDAIVYRGESIHAIVPEKVLGPGSLQLTKAESAASFKDWSERENQESFYLLKAISALWHEKKITDQFLVFGKDAVPAKDGFRWEMVPYEKTSWAVGRFWQQFKVMLNVVWGGKTEEAKLRERNISLFTKELPAEMASIVDQIGVTEKAAKGTDPFCKDEVIQNQRVFEGRSVNVLYPHTPIGIGSERLHFLFVPKEHKKDFNQLSGEEYSEAVKLAQLALEHFKKTRQVKNAYIYHKTGPDAGQTVEHWHMHLVITTSVTEDMMGKCKVLWNMVFPPSPLKGEQLASPVRKYKIELANMGS